MLPNSCEGEPLGTRTIRSKSFTSCFFEAVKPAGSVQARTTVTGIVGWLLQAMVKAEPTDDDENVSDV